MMMVVVMVVVVVGCCEQSCRYAARHLDRQGLVGVLFSCRPGHGVLAASPSLVWEAPPSMSSSRISLGSPLLSASFCRLPFN
uniref:Putative secreted protein n=1 Tax=Anopheles darlingi TaxID=43151 RepID=A0A2M4DLM6_ANODA